MLWGYVFLAATALDVVWALYTRHLVQHNVGPASFWAAMVIFLTGANVISYTENHWLLIPAAAGAAVGTFLTTWKPLTKFVAALLRNNLK